MIIDTQSIKNEKMKINFRYEGEFAPPKRESEFAAGIDLFNNLNQPVIIHPNQSEIISTGFYVEIPNGYVGFVMVRSSIGFKYNCTLANSVGVIDSDYRGEVKVKITNHSNQDFVIEPNMRVAQFIVVPCFLGEYIQVDELSETKRGEKGFGSTGK